MNLREEVAREGGIEAVSRRRGLLRARRPPGSGRLDPEPARDDNDLSRRVARRAPPRRKRGDLCSGLDAVPVIPGCLLGVCAPALHLIGETALPGTLGSGSPVFLVILPLPGLPRHAQRAPGADWLETTCEGPSATTTDDPSGRPRSAPCAAAASLWTPARAPDSRSLRTAGHPPMLGAEPSCIAASRGVTSLRPLRPVGRRSSGRVVLDRRCAASRRALGG